MNSIQATYSLTLLEVRLSPWLSGILSWTPQPAPWKRPCTHPPICLILFDEVVNRWSPLSSGGFPLREYQLGQDETLHNLSFHGKGCFWNSLKPSDGLRLGMGARMEVGVSLGHGKPPSMPLFNKGTFQPQKEHEQPRNYSPCVVTKMLHFWIPYLLGPLLLCWNKS